MQVRRSGHRPAVHCGTTWSTTEGPPLQRQPRRRLPDAGVNRIEQGVEPAWPCYCAGKQQVDPFIRGEPDERLVRDARYAKTKPSMPEYQGHAAPMSMVFYTPRMFPPENRNDCCRPSRRRAPPRTLRFTTLGVRPPAGARRTRRCALGSGRRRGPTAPSARPPPRGRTARRE